MALGSEIDAIITLRRRFLADRLSGLHDRIKPGRPREDPPGGPLTLSADRKPNRCRLDQKHDI